ncbi:hypothetical protein CHS0354_025773 [Potamilus streckersoni]|uniref:PLAC domain-containing protein n=1 Tax=Potamilus streckersoni TaxID=2493646 RepID=A0AAE0VIT0_9BIVA|nr:hypothetical protein CHS0354_025773 [Potamilus streckersoni]
MRIIVCKQLINQDEEVILNESECTESRPSSERTCRRANCPPVWMAEEWSECSKKCGRGEMVRHVYCTTSDKQIYLDESQCDISKKPETIATCVKQSCPPPTWVIGEWSECSVECGQGWHERSVECMTFDGKPSDLCPKRDKPAVSQRCDAPCDQESGDDECADKYQVAYCPLVLKFRFCDREYFQRMCCKTCHGSRLH